MIFAFKRAVKDLFTNRFLAFVTIITIALSVLIVGAFVLFIFNANAVVASWKKDIKLMAYLKDTFSGDEKSVSEMQKRIGTIGGVADVQFISKTDALNELKRNLKRSSSLVDNLDENPLPDAFEIEVVENKRDIKGFESLAAVIESIPLIDEVEYGKEWLTKFSHFFNLLKVAGYALVCLFFIASVFIVANTIRLALYSRREELEIMRLVGASDGFIKTPFYIQGLFMGSIGGAAGLAAVYSSYYYITIKMGMHLTTEMIQIRFLPIDIMAYILVASVIIGWVGCFLSLRQFLKQL
jgi:cell division transport system permease protein